jgi:hypothetical protein
MYLGGDRKYLVRLSANTVLTIREPNNSNGCRDMYSSGAPVKIKILSEKIKDVLS